MGELIYYSDTVAFYTKYHDEINELLSETMSETGLYNLSELFGDSWGATDPLAVDINNQNLLAWFGFEETLRNIGYNFEALQFGEMLAFLYVSDSEEEWEYDRDDLSAGYACAYVKNLDDECCSEFGSIGIKPQYGGLVRTA